MSKANLRPAFASPAGWETISGMSRSRIYEEISKGNLHAKKFGKSLLIDVEHGLDWLRSLPEARIQTKPSNAG